NHLVGGNEQRLRHGEAERRAIMLGAKRLGLLHELVPKISVVAVLLDPDTAFEIELVETAARALGLQIVPVALASERDLDAAFDRIVATGAGALLFGGGPVLRGQLQQIVALAARHALPTIYELRDARPHRAADAARCRRRGD